MNPWLEFESFQISARRRVVGTGLIALDVLMNEDKSTVSSALGGSAGNVLAILAHLGWSSVPVAQVGMDSAAEHIRREFEDLHADVRFLVGEDHACTPIVFQLPGDRDKTHRFSFSCPHCGRNHRYSYSTNAQLGAPVLSEVKRSDVYFFDRVTSLSLKLAEDYRNRGALIVFEPSSMGDDSNSFERAIRAAHVIKYADDRIADLQAFDLSGVAIEIQTLGKEGLKFRSPSSKNRWKTLSAYPVQSIADTSGAGDWCTAGMLFSLFNSAHGRSIEDLLTANLSEALRFGQALATLNCQYSGARGMAQCRPAYQIFEMASALLDSASSYAMQEERTTYGWSSSIEKYHFLTEERSDKSNWTKLCCDGLAL